MKVKRIKKEDLVKLKDGSYAVKVEDNTVSTDTALIAVTSQISKLKIVLKDLTGAAEQIKRGSLTPARKTLAKTATEVGRTPDILRNAVSVLAEVEVRNKGSLGR